MRFAAIATLPPLNWQLSQFWSKRQTCARQKVCAYFGWQVRSGDFGSRFLHCIFGLPVTHPRRTRTTLLMAGPRLLVASLSGSCEDEGLSAKGRQPASKHLESSFSRSCLFTPCHAWLWLCFRHIGQTQQMSWNSCPHRTTCGPRALCCQSYRLANGL